MVNKTSTKVRIYTRTGDKGQTSLFDGTRVLKSNKRVEAYGDVDELNSVLGTVIAHLTAPEEAFKSIVKELNDIQHDLFETGSILANTNKKLKKDKESKEFFNKRIKAFERHIDTLTNELPSLKNFILPGGSLSGSTLHLARTVCRRVERKLVDLSQNEDLEDYVIKYFNRLSDLLFTMGRFVNFKEKKTETIWNKFKK